MISRYRSTEDILAWVNRHLAAVRRREAVASLSNYGASGDVRVAVISVLQNDVDSGVRVAAAVALGSFSCSDRSRFALVEALQDNTQPSVVRSAAARALAKHAGGLLVESALERARESVDPTVSQAAKDALRLVDDSYSAFCVDPPPSNRQRRGVG